MEPEQQMQRLNLFVERLGEHPDKEVIHQLTETARLGLTSGGVPLAKRMGEAIMSILANPETAPGRRIPLLYAVDSIAKYVGREYQPLLGVWLPSAFEHSFNAVSDEHKAKMHKLLTTWHERALFIEHLDALNAVVAPWHNAMRGQLAQPRPPAHHRPPALMAPHRPPAARVLRPAPAPPRPYNGPRFGSGVQAAARRTKRQPLAVAVRPPEEAPVAKRARAEPSAPEEEAAVVEAARSLLERLQGPLLHGDQQPMTLEEIKQTETELYEQVMAEARVVAANATATFADWPVAIESGPGRGSDEALFVDHGKRLANSLDYRVAQARRGGAPLTVTAALAKCAKEVAAHIKTLLQRRQTAADDPTSASSPQRRAAEIARRVAVVVEEQVAETPLVELGRAEVPVPRRVPAVAIYEDEDAVRAFEQSLLNGDFAVDSRVVDSLYACFATQCKEDGVRFATDQELQAHMDLIFKRNRRRRDKSRTTSRVWGPSALAWAHDLGEQITAPPRSSPEQPQLVVPTKEANSRQPVEPRVVVPDDSSTPLCRICGEAFQISFDEVSNEWILPDAVYAKVNDGKEVVVHVRCRNATCGADGVLSPDQLLPDPNAPSLLDNGSQLASSSSASGEDPAASAAHQPSAMIS